MTIRLLLLAQRPIRLDGLPLDVPGAELEDSRPIRRLGAIGAALEEFAPSVALVDTTYDERSG